MLLFVDVQYKFVRNSQLLLTLLLLLLLLFIMLIIPCAVIGYTSGQDGAILPLNHPSPPFQWCQNGAFLLLRAFIIALGRWGIIISFYCVQDKLNEKSEPPLPPFQWCQNRAFLLLRAFIIALVGMGDNHFSLFWPRLYVPRSGPPAVPRKKFPRKPCNKSFIGQVCSVKMAGYWARFFFLACLWTSTPSRSIHTQEKELGQYPAILT